MPEWECKIWRDAEVAQLVLENQDYYDEETNYGAKSDILRYELLYRYGGVYLDVDFVLNRPLDILHHTYTFYTGVMPHNTTSILTNGILGTVPGHPLMKACMKMIKYNRHKELIIDRTGPILFEKAFYHWVTKERIDERIIALPKSFFFPFDLPRNGAVSKNTSSCIKPETFATHYWAGSWHKVEKWNLNELRNLI